MNSVNSLFSRNLKVLPISWARCKWWPGFNNILLSRSQSIVFTRTNPLQNRISYGATCIEWGWEITYCINHHICLSCWLWFVNNVINTLKLWHLVSKVNYFVLWTETHGAQNHGLKWTRFATGSRHQQYRVVTVGATSFNIHRWDCANQASSASPP